MPCAVVTGASSGLGRGVAERLVELGWNVIGTVRDPRRAAEVAFETYILDVTDADAIENLGNHVDALWGSLDALVNNAGQLLNGPVEELSVGEFRRHLDVNVVGPAAMTRAMLPKLRVARGVVVQVSSVAGQMGFPLFGAYNATKFALEGLSEALLRETADQGVRVVLVEPSEFRTEIARDGATVSDRGVTGMYADKWREHDDWVTWMQSEAAPDAHACVEAIVGAVTRVDAPARIAVGEDTASDIRRHALDVISQVDASVEFLRTIRQDRVGE